MKSKSLKIDWDELDQAFNNQNSELVYYLDLVTGHVILEGQGEDDDEVLEAAAAVPPPPATQGRPLRAYVEPPNLRMKVAWIREFLRQEDIDPDAVAAVEAGLQADDPAPAVRDALNQHPETRDRWYLFRSDRIHDLIGSWLAQHSIIPAEPPPWE